MVQLRAQNLEDQLRHVRRQTLLRDSAARRTGSTAECGNLDGSADGESGNSPGRGDGGDDSPSSSGSRRHLTSEEEDAGAAPPGQAGPHANRLIVLTKRLEVSARSLSKQ